MATISTQSVYLLENENGKLDLFQFAPTQDYSGRKGSDSYSLMMGLFIDNPSHDLWIGEVVCHRNTPYYAGVNTVKDLKCKIVAKWRYDWDMSRPMGQRRLNEQKTANFDQLYTKYKSTN